jgi:hypothetical protein
VRRDSSLCRLSIFVPDINESEDIAASRIAKMLNDALEESISANGAPVEVAFHPAINGKRLQDLTPYAAQRYQ